MDALLDDCSSGLEKRALKRPVAISDDRFSVAEWILKTSGAQVRGLPERKEEDPVSSRYSYRLPPLARRGGKKVVKPPPISEELQRRRQRHPRLRWRKLGKDSEACSHTGGIISKEDAKVGQINAQIDSEIEHALQSEVPYADEIVIDQGSLFYTGSRVVVESPRRAAERLQSHFGTTGIGGESARSRITDTPRITFGQESRQAAIRNVPEIPSERPRSRPALGFAPPILPAATLLPRSRMWRDVQVGTTATMAQGASLVASPSCEQVKRGTGQLAMQKPLAPFSHIMAKDIAQGRTVRGVPSIEVRPASREVVSLNFKSWGLDDSYLQCLCRRISLSAIKAVDMADNRLTDSSIDFLVELARDEDRWEALEELSLPDNHLYEAGGEAVARLISQTQPALLKLDLSGNNLGDRACEKLCDALMRKCHASLRDLALARNGIGAHDEAGIAMGQLVVATVSLESLSLHYNLLHGVGALAVVQGVLDHYQSSKPRLSSVDLSWNRLGMRCNQPLQFSAPEASDDANSPASTIATEVDCGCAVCALCVRIAKVCESIVIEGPSLTDFNLAYNGMRPAEIEAISTAGHQRAEGQPTRRASFRQLASRSSLAGQPLPLQKLQLRGNLPTPRTKTPERATSAGEPAYRL